MELRSRRLVAPAATLRAVASKALTTRGLLALLKQHGCSLHVARFLLPLLHVVATREKGSVLVGRLEGALDALLRVLEHVEAAVLSAESTGGILRAAGSGGVTAASIEAGLATEADARLDASLRHLIHALLAAGAPPSSVVSPVAAPTLPAGKPAGSEGPRSPSSPARSRAEDGVASSARTELAHTTRYALLLVHHFLDDRGTCVRWRRKRRVGRCFLSKAPLEDGWGSGRNEPSWTVPCRLLLRLLLLRFHQR